MAKMLCRAVVGLHLLDEERIPERMASVATNAAEAMSTEDGLIFGRALAAQVDEHSHGVSLSWANASDLAAWAGLSSDATVSTVLSLTDALSALVYVCEDGSHGSLGMMTRHADGRIDIWVGEQIRKIDWDRFEVLRDGEAAGRLIEWLREIEPCGPPPL